MILNIATFYLTIGWIFAVFCNVCIELFILLVRRKSVFGTSIKVTEDEIKMANWYRSLPKRKIIKLQTRFLLGWPAMIGSLFMKKKGY